jgi:hypothetical protein
VPASTIRAAPSSSVALVGPARESRASRRRPDRLPWTAIEHPSYDTLMDPCSPGRREGDSIKMRRPSAAHTEGHRVLFRPCASQCTRSAPRITDSFLTKVLPFANSAGLKPARAGISPPRTRPARARRSPGGHGERHRPPRHCPELGMVGGPRRGVRPTARRRHRRWREQPATSAPGACHEAWRHGARALDFLGGTPGRGSLCGWPGARRSMARPLARDLRGSAGRRASHGAWVLDSPTPDLMMEIDEMLAANHVPAFLVSGPLMAVAGLARALSTRRTVKPGGKPSAKNQGPHASCCTATRTWLGSSQAPLEPPGSGAAGGPVTSTLSEMPATIRRAHGRPYSDNDHEFFDEVTSVVSVRNQNPPAPVSIIRRTFTGGSHDCSAAPCPLSPSSPPPPASPRAPPTRTPTSTAKDRTPSPYRVTTRIWFGALRLRTSEACENRVRPFSASWTCLGRIYPTHRSTCSPGWGDLRSWSKTTNTT